MMGPDGWSSRLREGQGVVGPSARNGASAVATRGRPFVVLLVEDNAADADLTLEALTADADVAPGEVHVVRDGEAALAFLRRGGEYASAPMPDLILLDLNLPGLDGRAVLGELRRDPALQDIPVVMLSSSSAREDVAGAYRSGANCFVTKPVELDCYLAAIRAIQHFWRDVVTLPA